MNFLWCNGDWMNAENLTIRGTDRGVTHGLGVFETMLAVNGRVPFGDRHFARLAASLERLGWMMPDRLEMGIMTELLGRNHLQMCTAKMRLTVTAGSGGLHDISAGCDAVCWITTEPFTANKDSLKIMISPWRRNEQSPLAGLKCASYAENLFALDHARRNGHDEVLLFNTAGDLCEAAMANVFLVKNDCLFTPSLDSGCLPGVVREVTIELARNAGILCHETRLRISDLEHADAIFLTSALRGPVPVGQLEARIFSDNPLVRRIVDDWQHEVRRRCEG